MILISTDRQKNPLKRGNLSDTESSADESLEEYVPIRPQNPHAQQLPNQPQFQQPPRQLTVFNSGRTLTTTSPSFNPQNTSNNTSTGDKNNGNKK